MLKIKDVKVYNLGEAIIKSGFPMDTGKIINDFNYLVSCVEIWLLTKSQSNESFGENLNNKRFIGKEHYNRAIKLGNTKNGEGHNCYLKSIRVSFNLKYPEYISPQIQRYNWFDIESSQSKMHKIIKIDIKNQCNKYVDKEIIENLNFWIKIYNDWLKYDYGKVFIPKNIKNYMFLKKDDFVKDLGAYYTKYEIFMKIISNCPLGLEKWMGISTNYMQLLTIYNQRKHHKLKEDYINLCSFIENLPHFVDLCLNGKRIFTNNEGNLLAKYREV